jgi:hypothetical protein
VRARTSALIVVAAVSTAACGTWFDKDDFLPSSPSIVNALALASAQPSIPADGFSTARVTATISADAALANRIVVFETTTGTFVGAPDATPRAIERMVDTSGSATVDLRSSRTVESARVTARVKDIAGLSKEVLIAFTPPTAGDIIRVSAAAPSAPADGITITPITAEISGALPSGRRMVTFTTTLGDFLGDPANRTGAGQTSIDAPADGANRAVAFLRSPKDAVGTAFVTARVDNPPVSAVTNVQFTRAAPQRVLVTTNRSTVEQDFDPPLVVTATLVRDPGTVTAGTIVTFRAVDANGNEHGLFSKVITTNASGVATAEFTAGTLAPLGPLTIIATAEGVSGSTTVQVVPGVP